MKVNQLILALSLVIFLAACGLNPVQDIQELGEPDLPVQASNTPTQPEVLEAETPVPTQAPSQTAEPEPTAEAQPAVAEADSGSTSDEVLAPAGLEFYETLEGGYRFLYPAEWVAEDFFGLTFLATDEQLLENSEQIDSGAFMMIISVPEEELESSSLIENLGFAADGLHPDPAAGDPVILSEPAELDLNGYSAVQILVEYPHSETGPVTTMITLIQNEGRFISLMGSTPSSESSDYLPLFEAITGSISLMEPVEVVFDGGDFNVDTPIYDEILTEPIAVDGPAVKLELPENSQVILPFEAEAGMVIEITVRGTGEVDLVLELTDQVENSLVGVIDQGHSFEEIPAYEIPESGLYNLVVSEYGRQSGVFSAEIIEVEPVLLYGATSGSIKIWETIEGFLAEGEVANWQFDALEGDWIFVTVEPEDDFDVAFDVVDENGQSITESLSEVDDSFSGGAEYTLLDIPADGSYTIQIRGFAGDGGSYSLSVE
ncbi:MAG: hypothetical protein AB8G95_04595 [Anaerolineae bacterium]